MTAPKPLSAWQEQLPSTLPRHVRRNIAEGPAGCWLWARSTSRDGYGWASLNNKTWQAHRLTYTLLVGEPPLGLVLDHLCRVRHCVNPAHLEPVTHRENLRRGDTPTGATTCKDGHPLSELRSQRRCLVCLRQYEEDRLELKRAAESRRRARIRGAR